MDNVEMSNSPINILDVFENSISESQKSPKSDFLLEQFQLQDDIHCNSKSSSVRDEIPFTKKFSGRDCNNEKIDNNQIGHKYDGVIETKLFESGSFDTENNIELNKIRTLSISDDEDRNQESDDADSLIEGKKEEALRRSMKTDIKFSKLKQQQLMGYQLVVTPVCIDITLLLIGFTFISVGIVALVVSMNTFECYVGYTDKNLGGNTFVQFTRDTCTKDIEDVSGDLYLFYELRNFFQNHREYLSSICSSQLRGTVYTSKDSLSCCNPLIERGGKLLHPCGLVALSVFNDTFKLISGNSNSKVELDETRQSICWEPDIKYRFKNPTDDERKKNTDLVDFWLESPQQRELFNMDLPGVGFGVENSHFIVWMKIAALPNFRKLYAKIPGSFLRSNNIQLPLIVEIGNNFPTYETKTQKGIILTEASWLGGRNDFIGITYICMGSISLIILVVMKMLNHQNIKTNKSIHLKKFI